MQKVKSDFNDEPSMKKTCHDKKKTKNKEQRILNTGSTCTHDSLHSCLVQTAGHITQVLNVSICKHWNVHCLPAAKHTSTKRPHVDRNAMCHEYSNLSGVTETHNKRLGRTNAKRAAHLTALMCSQLAIPVMAPFCSLVLPCTVKSLKKINRNQLKTSRKTSFT